MADLGSTTIFGDLTINGSIGGAVRLAYCGADAGAATTIACFLDTDATGESVTVQCLTGSLGASLLNASVPRLSDGDPMLVIKHNDTWYSATIFEDSEDFDEGVAMPKLKYITGYALTDNPATPVACTDANWAVSKAIIKAIKIQTSSTNWDLSIWTNTAGSDLGLYDGGFVEIANALSGDQVILLDLPYIDYDSSSSVHLLFDDTTSTNTATVDVYGVEART